MSSRFPFEEDWRRRFGEFYELVPRYIAIGRHPVKGPRAATTRDADQTPAHPKQTDRAPRGPNSPRVATSTQFAGGPS
jgi:hypothetical protein